MNCELVEKIANAVLYEGYMLYPYTASSVKNLQRWNFGILHPPAYDVSEMQVECLAVTGEACNLGVRVRFLQSGETENTEAREIDVCRRSLESLAREPVQHRFRLGLLDGEIGLAATLLHTNLHTNLFRVSVRVGNRTQGSRFLTRDAALCLSMLSTQAILPLQNGEWVSMTDPPGEYESYATACRNTGLWPVLVGAQGERDVMLASPIILSDYPQIASESAGDLFDATEIDEILTLRILTLSDEEKEQIRRGDEKAREVLERTESLPAEHLMKMHGALRGLRQVHK